MQSTSVEQLPPDVMRYLAWAASRSLPKQRLEADWASRYRPTLNGPMAEPPPPALAALQPRHRSIRLIHPVLGERPELSREAADELLDDGWIPDSTEQSNFLESVHIQAYDFQVRWFPRPVEAVRRTLTAIGLIMSPTAGNTQRHCRWRVSAVGG